MKTPREVLFARHQAAAPKLDAIRHAVVGKLNNEDAKTGSFLFRFASLRLCCLDKIWLELIWPCRRIWTGLAAVWILIFIFNFSTRDKSELMAKNSPPPSPEMILTFRQQEMLLAELTGLNEPQAAERPKTFSAKPSSQRQFEILVT